MTVDREDVSSLVYSAGLVFVGGLLHSLSSLIERVIIGRAFSPDVYGEVSIGLAIVSFAVTVSLIGFNQGIPRFIARFDDPEDIRGIWLVGLVLAGGISVALSILLILGSGLLTDRLFENAESLQLLHVFAVAIPFVVGLRVGIGGIRGLENTVFKTYTDDLLYPGVRILALVALLSVGFGVLSPGYAYLIAAGFAFLVGHLFLNRLVSLVGAVRLHARELVSFSIPLVIATVVSVLLTQTDTLMLGYFRPSYDVGLYAAAYPLAHGLLVILSAFGYLYLPLASRLDAENKRDEVEDIYQLSSKWVFIVTFPLFAVFVAFSEDVLTLIFSSDYRAGGTALAILSLGFFTNAMVGRNRETLSALGYPRGVLISNVVAFALNVVLNLALIPPYGSDGAAVASAASFILLNVVVYAILKQKYGITPLSQYTVRTFSILPLVILPPAAILSHWVTLDLVSLAGLLVIAGAVTVAIVSVTGCLQPEDRIPLEILEEHLGVRLPLIRRFIPE